MKKLAAGTVGLFLTLSSFLSSSFAAAPPTAPDVIHASTAQWVQAAQTGRADMLILGDSVVALGWDAGFNRALANRFGLAATGILGFGLGEGEGFESFASLGSSFNLTGSGVRADRQGYVWRNQAVTGDAAPTGVVVYSVDAAPLASSSGYDLHLYTVPTASSGTFQYSARLGDWPFTTTVPLTSPQAVTLPPQGLEEINLHFDRPAEHPTLPLNFFVTPANLSVLYGRMTVPGAKGASLTTWGYGGHGTFDFYNDQWNGQGVTPAGRKAWFDAITAGGSGKLNVLISEGFNDRNAFLPSLHGITPGNSAAAFADNVKGLIQKIRDEWSASGRLANDLSFTLLGMYEDSAEHDQITQLNMHQLHDFAFELQAIAANDPQISFINLQNHVGDYPTINAAGWIADGLHPTGQGANAMSQIVVDTMVPEPGALSFILFGLLPIGRRRRAA